MRLKILMMGDDPSALVADYQLLREKGFLVYTAFNGENFAALVDEISPDVLFVACENDSTDLFAKSRFNPGRIPVIYALAEDDLYFVHQSSEGRRKWPRILSDNLSDSIRAALDHHKKPYIPKTFQVEISEVAPPFFAQP